MDVLQQMTGVAVVFALLGVTILVLRRNGLAQLMVRKPQGERRLQLVERLSLTPQHSVHLVRLDKTLMVIGVSPTGCNVLDSRVEATEGKP
jgi:flagellar biogenesis protein FliO